MNIVSNDFQKRSSDTNTALSESALQAYCRFFSLTFVGSELLIKGEMLDWIENFSRVARTQLELMFNDTLYNLWYELGFR